ncbi:AEC family transporter [Nocardia sp. NPDC048505]|uniref:AEC family transporter n=1 Tax=unclassified Nocardia TaxID=2637762 RepID=UPI00340C17BC
MPRRLAITVEVRLILLQSSRMQLATTAIVPVVFILVLGAVLRRRTLNDPGFWRGLEWMSYWVFTPALFVASIAATDLGSVSIGLLVFGLAVPIGGTGLLVIALRKVLRVDGPQLTSLIQGSIRINTYIGLVFASALHGAQGVATFAIAAAVVVPLVNIISVTALSIWGEADPARRSGPWRELVFNPLILGCLAGLGLNLSGVGLGEVLAAPIQLLASPALMCGTLAAGAAITLQLRLRDAFDIGMASILKLVALPLLAGALAHALGVTGAVLASIVIICALPTAPSAYILATRMGGDTRLMASITGVQTILATITLPGVLMLTGIM